jgi:hypothetical protein
MFLYDAKPALGRAAAPVNAYDTADATMPAVPAASGSPPVPTIVSTYTAFVAVMRCPHFGVAVSSVKTYAVGVAESV